MSKRIITINRMYGSNGRIIGKALAEEMGIGFYDRVHGDSLLTANCSSVLTVIQSP